MTGRGSGEWRTAFDWRTAMKALWKLCLVVVVVVGGLVGQVVMPPEGTKIEMIEWALGEDCYGLDWRPDTAGYPRTLSTKLINSEGEVWRAGVGGLYTIMRADGSFTDLDINGVFIRSGTWFTIENYQITDHPYQRGPATVNIVYYNFQRNDGTIRTDRLYYTFVMGLDESTHAQIRNCEYITKVPTE
ncbi:MAG: hypothetical protein FWC23_07425 [Chitinispirillia bacterium]|nr:hypothetical protein [Chitinispirillia bacterium]